MMNQQLPVTIQQLVLKNGQTIYLGQSWNEEQNGKSRFYVSNIFYVPGAQNGFADDDSAEIDDGHYEVWGLPQEVLAALRAAELASQTEEKNEILAKALVNNPEARRRKIYVHSTIGHEDEWPMLIAFENICKRRQDEVEETYGPGAVKAMQVAAAQSTATPNQGAAQG